LDAAAITRGDNPAAAATCIIALRDTPEFITEASLRVLLDCTCCGIIPAWIAEVSWEWRSGALLQR